MAIAHELTLSYNRDQTQDILELTGPLVLIDGNGNVLLNNNNLFIFGQQISTNYESTESSGTSVLINGNGNAYILNGSALVFDDSEPEVLGNYFILDNDVKTPIYIRSVSINGGNISKVFMSDNVTDFELGYHCSFTNRPSSEGFYCSENDYSGTNSWYLNLFSNTRLEVPLVDTDFNPISTTGRTIKKIILTSITGSVKNLGKKFFEWARTDVEVIDISKAVTVDIRSAFNGYTNLKEIKMNSASSVTLKNASASLGGTFANTQISSLSFPSLTTQSTIVIDTMLTGLTGCSVHFPSNLVSTIESLTGYPNFGGTNTTLIFDLPSTQ